MKKIILAVILLILTAACFPGNKAKTKEEIYTEMENKISGMMYFKYTSQDSAYLTFYDGQTVNTFSLDKKGNGYSNNNGEQIYKVDGSVYIRSVGLKQEGTSAEVIMDTLTEDEKDIGYFDRNSGNIKKFLISNMKAFSNIPNQKITTEGKDIKIEMTDLKDTDYKSLDKIEISYKPGKSIKYLFSRTENSNGESKKYTITDVLIFDSGETIKLPELMPTGTKLELK